MANALVPRSGGAPKNATAVAAASLVVKDAPGSLFNIVYHNNNAGTRYLQFHDATSLPADTAVPKMTFAVPTGLSIKLGYGAFGRRFHVGIVVAHSSTALTLTVGTTDGAFDVQYL